MVGVKALSYASGTFLSGPAVIGPLQPGLKFGKALPWSPPVKDVAVDELLVEAPKPVRRRLWELPGNLHCSIIGTCLSTAELRKLMARSSDVKGASDLDLHHDAVRLSTQGGELAKALHKALDHRHALTLRSFAKARDEAALAKAWSEACQQGEIPGAYWALLTHRCVTP